MFKLTIKTGNAAFHTWNDPDHAGGGSDKQAARDEVARILREAAQHLECGGNRQTLYDVNGNKVGDFILELEG